MLWIKGASKHTPLAESSFLLQFQLTFRYQTASNLSLKGVPIMVGVIINNYPTNIDLI